ncbi:hypothetical protein FYJ43_06840 [Cutibacterium sp. WCA-380-WT-3A]|uniref:Uncharacterized protein n=1 Tax=Cutibacterium porci TaxID=2605781 RepID=A0A7K0J725_9ACTN|nr:hypothetical protein [Cutibacterium porci]
MNHTWAGFAHPVLSRQQSMTTAGVGMRLTYLDTFNIFFEESTTSDSTTIEEMASSSVIVE